MTGAHGYHAENCPLPARVTYKEYDNAQAARSCSKTSRRREFNALATAAEWDRRGRVRVSDRHFEGMDASASGMTCNDLRHLKDFSRCAIVGKPPTHHLWSSLVAPFMSCEVEHFAPGEEDTARDWLMWPEGAADIYTLTVPLPLHFGRRGGLS